MTTAISETRSLGQVDEVIVDVGSGRVVARLSSSAAEASRLPLVLTR
jgi:hypothetical protein